jgi:EAL domain-containing protein (putative c-di-GMP-specific phosphodiesterase class I)
VRSTVDLAHNLGLTVVAEGVESGKTWELLRALECDGAQGYHLGKPMPAGDFIAWATAWMAKNPGRPARSSASLTLH